MPLLDSNGRETDGGTTNSRITEEKGSSQIRETNSKDLSHSRMLQMNQQRAKSPLLTQSSRDNPVQRTQQTPEMQLIKRFD